MAGELRVVLETGLRGKRVVAVAPDWPGLSRGPKTGEEATELLLSYIPRYAPVAKLAGMDDAFSAIDGMEIVERYPGTGSTDFWGISFGFSSIDHQEMSPDALDRELRLMRAAWAFFDDVRSRVSAELRKGPRGGGRDRERIVRHVIAAELDWARKLGLRTPLDEITTGEDVDAHRTAYTDTIREYHRQGKMARNWPLRFLIRHTAFHTLDHAWEMEDKDLSATRAGEGAAGA